MVASLLSLESRRASAAFDAVEHHRLFRGHLVEDLIVGQRRWLVEHGRLARGRAMLR